MSSSISFRIYGAEEKCASCVHLPTAKETSEWLEAALVRKFPNSRLQFQYIDIEQTLISEEDQRYAEAIKEEEYFYPLVVLNGEVVGEGNPNLKEITKKVESLTTQSAN
ncbi:disulfide oxidoreductase [Alkalihalobacillus alcalophilus ATCC 27647 = CGMCC 1.3604]|uniref:Disulfide oxidoreductase n=1 Tax=Alkalihalobacillus alcalophilus ATCC 27647 = CGMCC 1.3604 TaxID=1218173 RepID=A0A094WIT5_ALKAL|nr:YuzD family protein [Alkalihalobacillus alcalophilus]KGA95848.1 disulfide oxidoreductase [Alkalihalobacillus alcalophilus ATCC 27647 = CGMCC 1.3604]MED1563443.1 YuzD family protein [Alkalihalobacillus alcalophilus]THG89314.1 disulfide oxidoreductase [Alkalihalobacillus alcalophilus ATCC 27647 = CGMCC 1.3604]